MVKERKIKIVKELVEHIKKYPVVGILNMYKIPATQLQRMRKSLKGKAKIIMAKKTLIKRALEESGINGIKKLEEHIVGQPAFIFTDMNPFKLFKILEESKTTAPAKPGDIAPKDIIIKQGNTGLDAGPVIGQLSDVGVVTKVEGGKVHVVKDTKVASEGDVITPELANVLGLLKMEPMEIGLDLVAAYENGIIYDKSVLRIDEEETLNKLISCIKAGVNLSLNSSYITKLTAPLAIQKAYLEARAVALEAGVYEKEVIEDLIVKAHREAEVLKSHIGKEV